MSSDYRIYPQDDALIVVLENVLDPISVTVSAALHEALFRDRLAGTDARPEVSALAPEMNFRKIRESL